MGCLPYLRARAQAECDAQTLLRPASGPGEGGPGGAAATGGARSVLARRLTRI